MHALILPGCLAAACLTGAAIPLATNDMLTPEKPAFPIPSLSHNDNYLLYGRLNPTIPITADQPFSENLTDLLHGRAQLRPSAPAIPRNIGSEPKRDPDSLRGQILIARMPIIDPPAPELAKILTAPESTGAIPLLPAPPTPIPR